MYLQYLLSNQKDTFMFALLMYLNKNLFFSSRTHPHFSLAINICIAI